MKKMLAFLLALMCAVSAAGAESADYSAAVTEENRVGPGYVTGSDDWVSLFEAPDGNSAEIALIWPGEAVEIYSYPDSTDFTLCEYCDMVGFVRSGNVSQAETATYVEEEIVDPGSSTVSVSTKEDNPRQYVYDDNWIGQLIVVDGYGDVPLYEHPSVDSAVLAQMSPYARVYAYNYPPNPDFYVIEYLEEDLIGFARTEYIDWKYGSDRNNPGYNIEERPGKWIHDGNYIGFMTVASGGAVVYEHPDTRSPQKTTLAAGEAIEVYDYSAYGDDFYLCETSDGPGFIPRQYLSDRADAPSSGSSNSSASSGMTEDRPGKWMNSNNALGEWYVAHCNEWVSLREHPDTNSTRLEKVYLNDIVQAYEYSPNPDFYLCETGSGNIGFILVKYLECVMDVPDGYYESAYETSTYVEEYLYVGPMRVANCSEWVSLREYPDTNSTRLQKVALGEYVEAYMYPSNPDFYLCEYNGQSGFILKEYLEYGTDAPSGSSSASVRTTENDPWQYITEENFIAEMTVVNCDEWVSLREHPSTKSERLTEIELGETVDAYYYPPNPDFYVCLFYRAIGFVLTDYLE